MTSDYYEEERREKASRIIGLADILETIARPLKQAALDRDGRAIEIADDALGKLVAVLGACSPLAHRRENNGKQAFMWIEPRPNADPSFRWFVCNADGSSQSGQESTQHLCEAAVEKLLH